MNFKYLISLCSLCVSCLLTACKQTSGQHENVEQQSTRRMEMEQRAAKQLEQARVLLREGQAAAAKHIIEQMRKENYLAIDARKRGIVLMDSIDLYDARKSLEQLDKSLLTGQTNKDSFEEACRKVQFYERKLKYDLQN